MATRTAADRHFSILSIARLAEPLSLPEFLLVTVIAVATATLYCQAHCFITSPPFHHGLLMPLEASLAWAAPAAIPWIACFELCKRQLGSRAARPRWPLLVAAFTIAIVVSTWAEQAADDLIGMGTRPLSSRLADQLPAILLTIGALLIVKSRLRDRTPETDGGRHDDVDAALLAAADRIDWIEAAGNYVEVHAEGRTTLHRITMRRVEALLDTSRFVRIHRSTIVNWERVADPNVDSSGMLRMKDGTLLRFGERYRGSRRG